MKWKIAILLISCMFLSQGVYSQKKSNKKVTVAGYALTEFGAPISGVSFFVDDVRVTRITNEKGFFKFKIRPDTRSIVAIKSLAEISEIEYTGQDSINFIFKFGPSPLDFKVNETEEVVDMGYRKSKRSDIVTSVGSIDVERINKANYNNIFDMIKGQIPGVVVSRNTITIRGTSSFNLSTKPLYVVNGVVTSSIDNIPPTEVESINILKGAAASMYGSRGTNGVLVIKLKSGKK